MKTLVTDVSRCCLNRSVALTLLVLAYVGSGCAQNSTSEAKSREQAPAVRDGSHDFDFIYGKWRMPNHKLRKRLAGAHEWDDFVTCDEGSPLPGGIGNIDYWKASYWKDFVGVTFRTYDPKTGLWRIYWVDNRFSGGVIQPPVAGKFEGNVGIFEGPDTFNGKPIVVRFTWTVNPKGAPAVTDWEKALNPNGLPVIAKWEQAFSADDGKNWETNWYNEFIQDDHCTLTPSVVTAAPLETNPAHATSKRVPMDVLSNFKSNARRRMVAAF